MRCTKREGFDMPTSGEFGPGGQRLAQGSRAVAVEYDVDWDETKDVGEEVKEVLDKEKQQATEEVG